MNVKITEVSVALPKTQYDNKYFEEFLDTSDEWISKRTGIKKRYLVNEDESSYSLAVEAINKIQQDLSDIDGLLVASMSSMESCPSLSSQLLQHCTQRSDVFTSDVNVGCSGFIHTFLLASSLIQTGVCSKIVIVATEQMSRLLDFEDRGTAILFGDAAGIVVLEKANKETVTNIVTKTVSNNTDLYTDDMTLHMNGQNVFKFAVKEVSNLITEIGGQPDYYLLHQANTRIIDSIAKRAKVSLDKFVINLPEYGNTSAASIVLILNDIFNDLKENDKLLLIGYGAGLTWGGFIYEHTED